MFSLLISTCLILIVALVLLRYLQKIIYWRQHNIDCLNCLKLVWASRKKHVAIVGQDVYQHICDTDKPLAAIEAFLFSVVLIRDLEAIKAITINNYDCFTDRGFYVNNRDPVSMNIARLEQRRWKPLRQKLNALFTPANMRAKFPLVLKMANEFVEVLKEHLEAGSKDIELRNLSIRYTIDVMGNAIVGIESHCIWDSEEEILVQSDNGFKVILPLILDHIGAKYSKLLNFFNVKVYPQQLSDYFARLARKAMEDRENYSIRGNDVMDILTELHKKDVSGGDYTFDFVVGQTFAFYIAGSQSSAMTISFALFELVKNPELQSKARQSIREHMQRHDGQITYDNVQELEYVKQIILETLRKYPVGSTMTRNCTRTCTIPTKNGPLRINAATSVIIPVYAIHHDPQYYPNPQEFQPDRFTDEAIAQRPAQAYLPFGSGPKACLADRFAKKNLILSLALLLLNFRFSNCERTPKVLEFDAKNMFMFMVKDGIHLSVERIENKL